MTVSQPSDWTMQVQLAFSHGLEAPYLQLTSVIQAAENRVALTFTTSLSAVTLAISNINDQITLGTATISGSVSGEAVNWTGSFDMSTSPLVGTPLAGWPASAFATELATASIFSPLAWVLSVSWPPISDKGATEAPLHMDLSWKGWAIVKALVVGGIAAAAATVTAPVSIPTIAVAGLAGADASLWSDLISHYQIPYIKPTAAVFEPPVTETVPVPVQSYSQDDPPPPGSGGTFELGPGTLSATGDVIDLTPPNTPPSLPPPEPPQPPAPPPPPDGGDVPPGGLVLPDGGGSGEGPDDKPGIQPK